MKKMIEIRHVTDGKLDSVCSPISVDCNVKINER